MNNRQRVVVTGFGAITPLGLDAETTWQGLVAGRSGVIVGQRFDATDYPVKIAAEVNGFDPKKTIPHKEVRRMGRFSQFAVAATREALVRANLLDEAAPLDAPVWQLDSERVGIILGTCIGGFEAIRDGTQTLLEKSYRRIRPTFITSMIHNAPAANISRLFGFTGYNGTITTSCAAGAQAIGEAAEVIRRGHADVMIAGGTESPITDLGAAGFWSMRALTGKYNDQPTRASRPFDRDRDGLVIGEGAATLILESWEHAHKRGAPIYAELVGFGCSGDAFHLAAPDPEGSGAVRTMKWALQHAGISPDQVDYISAHATSTPLGDLIETRAIKHLFKERAYEIPISAAKSMMGHSIGASGAIEAVVCIQSLRDQKIHPTINYETPDPDCDLDYVPNGAREAKLDVILSNSFGMGGQNVSLVIGRVAE